MSRVKKLDKIKKQKIKETIIGIALAISIGIGGSAGSYAYFSDRVNTNNGIKITMGTLDVGISEGFNLNINGIKKDNGYLDDIENEFTIINEGTLDEILKFKFNNIKINGDSNHPDLSKIEYELNIGNKEIVEANLNELSTKGIDIGRLNSGDSITCTAELDEDDDNSIQPDYNGDRKIEFDVIVEGVQINDKSVVKGGAN